MQPRAALRQFPAAWPREGGDGAYGFYEAIDYTRDRLPRGQRSRRGAAASWPTTRA